MTDARERWNQASNKVSVHQGWEGRSTTRGGEVYLDAYDAAGAYIRELEQTIASTRVQIVRGRGATTCKVLLNGVLVFDGEDFSGRLRMQQPDVHMIVNGGMLHALVNVSMTIQSTDDWEKVTCEVCLQQKPPILEELPPHQDYDEVCTHVGAYYSVIMHTQASTDGGPDYCMECSEAVQEWVAWPCPRAERPGAKG